jgi:murein DD-endopeptidase MepM/ murein hydrolase activator NlpD
MLVIITMGCALASQVMGVDESPPSANSTPAATIEVLPTIADTPTSAAIETSESVEVATATLPSTPEPPTEFSPCYSEQCITDGTFFLSRPIGPTGRNIIDPTYRFGDNRRGKSDPNHGVSFLNSMGTPVLAAASGEVVAAGDDHNKVYAMYPDRYGNLVILKHNLHGLSQPVFTLYAHLSEIFVEEGEFVDNGQEIGLVGMSGDTSGSNLHFEVRLGENSYQAVRNPELWLQNLLDEEGQTQGTIAGRVVDDNGKVILIPHFVIERLGGPGQPALDTLYIGSYTEKRLTGLSPWEESFAMGDLPPSSYQITFLRNNDTHQRVVDVLPGQLTFVTFQIEGEN